MVFAPVGTKVPVLAIKTLQDEAIELVDTYKYLGFWLDKGFTFKKHIEVLAMKLKFTLAFSYRLKSCFFRTTRKRLVAGLFMSQIDYGDIIYQFACPSTLSILDPLYRAALRFITNAGYQTHHCILYNMVNWPSLKSCRMRHWHIFIYKVILGILSSYICLKFVRTQSTYQLRSSDVLLFKVPRMRTEAGKRVLSYYGPLSWNELQSRLKIGALISLAAFKKRISDMRTDMCNCFN